MRRKLLPYRRALQKGFALARREIAQVTKGYHQCLAAWRRQVAPLGEDVARFLPLGGRKSLQDLFALTNRLLLLGSHGVPLPQALADQILALRRQALELRIILHDAPLLRRGEFTQVPENSARQGALLRRTPIGAAIGFPPAAGIRILADVSLRMNQSR